MFNCLIKHDVYNKQKTKTCLEVAHLCSPDVVQVLHGKSFLFYNEAKDLLQLLDILRLMQTVPQHNRKDVVLLDPFLMREEQILQTQNSRNDSLECSAFEACAYRHALCGQPLLLLRVMPMSVVGDAGYHLVNFV